MAEMSSDNVEEGEVGMHSWVCRIFEDVNEEVYEGEHGKVECDPASVSWVHSDQYRSASSQGSGSHIERGTPKH